MSEKCKARSALYRFDRLLCQHVCQSIRYYLQDKMTMDECRTMRDEINRQPFMNMSGGRYSQFQRQMQWYAEQGYRGFAFRFASLNLPNELKEFILTGGQKDMLLNDHEFGSLAAAFEFGQESTSPAINAALARPAVPNISVYNEFGACLPELRGATAESDLFCEFSVKQRDRLCNTKLTLGSAIALVQDWCKWLRYFYKIAGCTSLLPRPDGDTDTPTKCDPSEHELAPVVREHVKALKRLFDESPECIYLSGNQILKLKKRGGNRADVFHALRYLKSNGPYVGKGRGRPPKKKTETHALETNAIPPSSPK